jgi:hypothetical protein
MLKMSVRLAILLPLWIILLRKGTPSRLILDVDNASCWIIDVVQGQYVLDGSISKGIDTINNTTTFQTLAFLFNYFSHSNLSTDGQYTVETRPGVYATPNETITIKHSLSLQGDNNAFLTTK